MHIVITGANGFIGRHLAERLLEAPASLPGGELSRLSLLDLDFGAPPSDPRVQLVKGSFADPAVLEQCLAPRPADLVFHLASVPSGLAETNFALGMAVNVQGMLQLLEALHAQANRPTLVFASSIAVYGKPAASVVNDATPPSPNLSYGAQKVVGETLLADYCRRGWLQGCSVRIPGIVTRPPAPNGAVSIFFSDLIRRLSGGEDFTCPVSAAARSWLMSVQRCVDNLLHAAALNASQYGSWTLPALHVRIDSLVAAIERLFPEQAATRHIRYEPDPWVEENFGSYPPLHCPRAEAAGFRHDGDLEALVLNSLMTAKLPLSS